jgi:hypothetical protein
MIWKISALLRLFFLYFHFIEEITRQKGRINGSENAHNMCTTAIICRCGTDKISLYKSDTGGNKMFKHIKNVKQSVVLARWRRCRVHPLALA